MTKRSPHRAKSGVGYRRPPVHSRWRPGQSGNPRGRKKGSRSAASIIRSVLSRKVKVTEGGLIRNVDVLEAVIIRVAQDALRGEPKAAALLIKLAQTFSSPEDAIDQEALTDEDHKLLKNYLARELRKRGGKK